MEARDQTGPEGKTAEASNRLGGTEGGNLDEDTATVDTGKDQNGNQNATAWETATLGAQAGHPYQQSGFQAALGESHHQQYRPGYGHGGPQHQQYYHHQQQQQYNMHHQRPYHQHHHGQQQATGGHGYGVQVQPVASRPIAGTDWAEVKTNIGSIFWYNQKSGLSTWERPEDVPEKGPAKPKIVMDPRKLDMLRRAKAAGAKLAPEYEELLREKEENDYSKGKKDRSKKKSKKKAIAESANSEQLPKDEFDVTFTEEDVAPPEDSLQPNLAVKSEPKDPEVVKRSFEELLEEIGVHAFSRYEKELQKMKDDTRFQAVEEKKRRQFFDVYCSKAGIVKMNKVTAQERGKDTRGRKRSFVADVEAEDRDTSPHDEPSTKAAINAFKALLQEKVLHSDSQWRDIKQALSKDDRFDGVKYWEQRELFRDHQRKLEKSEDLRRASQNRMDQDVRAGIERQMQSNRFDAINNFKALLTEMIRYPLAVWSQEKANLESDPQSRFDKKYIKDTVAQELFLEHVAQLKASAQQKVIALYRKHKVPTALTFSEVSQTFSEDFDFIEYPEEIQKEAWTTYVSSLEDG
eukprot:jgi/Picsp_1/4666/NSC_02036-R1_transcription elongation regulator 1-like